MTNKIGFINTKLVIETVDAVDRDECFTVAHMNATGINGTAGYVKFAHGNKPTNNEAGFSQLYARADVLYFLTSAGVEHEVKMEDE